MSNLKAKFVVVTMIEFLATSGLLMVTSGSQEPCHPMAEGDRAAVRMTKHRFLLSVIGNYDICKIKDNVILRVVNYSLETMLTITIV